MKFLNIFLLVFFFVFSCKSTQPDVNSFNEQLPAWTESMEQAEAPDELIIENAYEEIFEDEILTEEITDEYLLLAEDLYEDSYEDTSLYEEELPETDIILADIPNETDDFDFFESDAEETALDEIPFVFEPEAEIAEENELPEEEQETFVQELPEETPPVVSVPPVQAPPPPPVQPSPVQPPAPVLVQPPAPQPAPLPQPAPTPVPPPAPVQPPAQLPVQQVPEPPPLEEDTEPEPPRIVRRDNTIEMPVTPSQSVVTPRNDEIVFSRVVRATVGQMIEIPFRGTGWVYLGEMASRRGIVYSSRRLDPDGQSFIFMAEEAGTYTLNFFRQDFIRDYILNDHVQVIVGEAPSAEGAGWFNPPLDRGRVVADPRWPSALQEAEILRGNRPAQAPSSERTETTTPQAARDSAREPDVLQGNTLPQGAVVIPNLNEEQQAREIILEEMLLQRARESFNEGNAASAIALLDQYRDLYPAGSDELFWLYGQFYEANNPARNILLSLDYYRRLVREYPQSTRFNDARRRIAYLERFYINIQ